MRAGPAWLYEDVPYVDTARVINELGDSRPLWTRHFTNWRGFTWRVREAKCHGDRTALWSAHGWYSDDDLAAALSEIRCR